MRHQKILIPTLAIALFFVACAVKSTETTDTTAEQKDTYAPLNLSQEFKDYWYAGKAELNSYDLKQERYGEIHDGQSVLIFVTESFLNKEQVKADSHKEDNIPALKLNQTKKFNTGVYPYATMASIFSPLTEQPNAIKTTFSEQEWCGQSYIQLNNRDKYEIESHSYFESRSDDQLSLDKELLEDEIWTEIRIDPDHLPQGEIKMIPSMEFSALHHKEIKAYDAVASLAQDGATNTYTVTYPKLKRTLKIRFDKAFPYTIQGWEESKSNGLKTIATKMKTMKLDYWSKHSVEDLPLRDSLMLK